MNFEFANKSESFYHWLSRTVVQKWTYTRWNEGERQAAEKNSSRRVAEFQFTLSHSRPITLSIARAVERRAGKETQRERES